MKYYSTLGHSVQRIAVSEESVFMYVNDLPLVYMDVKTDHRAQFIKATVPLLAEEITQEEFEQGICTDIPKDSSFYMCYLKYKVETLERSANILGEQFHLN